MSQRSLRMRRWKAAGYALAIGLTAVSLAQALPAIWTGIGRPYLVCPTNVKCIDGGTLCPGNPVVCTCNGEGFCADPSG
jgi:hypothetical protein